MWLARPLREDRGATATWEYPSGSDPDLPSETTCLLPEAPDLPEIQLRRHSTSKFKQTKQPKQPRWQRGRRSRDATLEETVGLLWDSKRSNAEAEAWAGQTTEEKAEASSDQCIWMLLLLQLHVTAVSSCTFGALLDLELFLLGGRQNSFVGVVECCRSLAGLMAALPCGYLADRLPRIRILQAAVLCTPAIAVLTAVSLFYQRSSLLLISVCLWSAFQQSWVGAFNALLADLAPPGPKRTRVMSWQTIATNVGHAAGPLIQLGLLRLVGSRNTWSPGLLAPILVSGLLLILPLQLLMRFTLHAVVAAGACSPPTSMADCSPSAPQLAGQAFEMAPAAGGEGSPGRRAALDAELVEATEMEAGLVGQGQGSPHPAGAAEKEAAEEDQDPCTQCLPSSWFVVLLLEASYELGLMTAGLSVKYFPLYFERDFGLRPTELCALNAIFPLFVAALVPFCVRSADRTGQVLGIILWTTLGGAFQVVFSMCRAVPSAALAFFLRHAFMKSRDPLYQSQLMDCVARQYRGRFSCVAPVRATVWSASAAIGGLVLDYNRSNYRTVIRISGVMTCVLPTVLLAPLLRMAT